MKTNSRNQAGVKISVGIKAGGFNGNHSRKLSVLRVKSNIKAGQELFGNNHSRRLA